MNYSIPVFKKDQPDDSYKFQPLPAPSGQYPYHLNLEKIVTVADTGKMMFHMAGDTGGLLIPEARQGIVEQMTAQAGNGSFLYHLGDLVYHHGEASQYAEQFFKPFEKYPGPVFAIAGNHDGDVNPQSKKPYKSLDAFSAVFCDSTSRRVPFSGKSKRKSMVQPNVYWALDTPLATIIGLYSNVPKFGVVLAEQEEWFKNELSKAPKDKMLILCLHHSPYSADVNHGSSRPMVHLLQNAFEATGVHPDIVFSGHVHNYQRFHKTESDGVETPYIVAGSGGFDELHRIADLTDLRFEPAGFDGVVLKKYHDTNHGFLKITIERSNNDLNLNGKYYTVNDHTAALCDFFTVSKHLR